MNERDLFKLAESLEEFSLSDYTPQELESLLGGAKEGFKEKYFAYYDDVKDKSLKKQDW